MPGRTPGKPNEPERTAKTERSEQDTRRYRRQTLRIMVDYVWKGRVCCDYATTLGAGGMFLETEEKLAPGDVVKARFRLPRGEALHELEGKVVWCRETVDPRRASTGGAGIKFVDAASVARLARDLEDYEL